MNTEVADLAPGTRARNLRWINRFASLGERFFTRVPAAGLPDPHWIATSDACAAELGLAAGWNDDATLQAFSGNAPLPGMQPLASVYSGHQFGVWAGQLGDGRALWLGEIDAPDGPRELQLKGGGMTPYSRMGDGRAVLRSTIREFLCSEAMAALGIPTTRALCMTGSALPVRRETIETAAIVTRVAPSFLRFGHFEHFTHTQPDKDALRMLADFVIRHHCPALLTGATPDETTYLALLAEVARRTAVMIAGWQSVGFCHGVMNTDNMSILGLTIDYGPFGFLDAFEPGHICNHSDHNGRYSYARQPNAAFWNLHALAMALSPLVGDPDAAIDALDVFKSTFAESLAQRLSDKLGLRTRQPGDTELAEALLQRMAADRADMTITFRRLSTFSTADSADNATVRDLFIDREAFDAWGSRYAARLRDEQSDDAERAARMNRVNPKYVLRNHLAEEAIQAARQGDFSVTNRLMQILSHPFDEQPEHAAHAGFPPDWAKQLEVSCSS